MKYGRNLAKFHMDELPPFSTLKTEVIRSFKIQIQYILLTGLKSLIRITDLPVFYSCLIKTFKLRD
jgi:hypothetical protein